MKRFLNLTTISIASAVSAFAGGGHLDLMPLAVVGDPSRIETGSFDFDGFAIGQIPPQRIYENDLDEPIAGADLLAGEAGFTSPSATTAAALLSGTGYTHLAGGIDVRFDFRTFNIGGGATHANLWYWDGADSDNDGDYSNNVNFAPASGVTLTFDRGAGLFTSSVDGGASAVPGFVVGTTAIDDPMTADDETGFFHDDLDALLDDADSDSGTLVPHGLYVVSLDVSAGGIGSQPIYWIFNAGLGEEGELAADAARDVVPEPASLALCLIAGAAFASRRRN